MAPGLIGSLAAIVAVALGAGGTAHAEVDCEVDYLINGQWPTGFNVSVVLKNRSDVPVDGWVLDWQMPGDEQVTQLWNGALTQDGASISVGNLSYNSVIPAQGQVSFGFNGAHGGVAEVPTSFRLNGTSCGDDVAPEPSSPDASDRFSRIIEPADGSVVPTHFTVRFEVGGLTVEPAGPINPDAGHLHILVDTDFVEPGRSIPFDVTHLHYGKAQLAAELELPPGRHTLKLQFADGAHVALDGDEFTDEIEVFVAESRIVEPRDGATVPQTFTVRMQVDGLRVEPAGTINDRAGHLHILVDTDFVGAMLPIPFDTQHLHFGKAQLESELTLPPGSHTLKLQFADGAHVTLDGPQYRDEITVVVADPAAVGAGGGPDPEAPPAAPAPAPAPPAPPTGEQLYAVQCAGCHGDDGKGLGTFPSVLRPFPSRIAYLQKVEFDMPLADPTTCAADCSEAVTAYIEQVLLPAQGLVGSVIRDDPGATEPAADPAPPPAPRPELVCESETPGPRALRLLTRREYENTVGDLLGLDVDVTNDLPVEARVKGYENNFGVNVVTARHVDAYLALAGHLAERAVAERSSALLSCDPTRDPAPCAREFVERTGLRAYRRPLGGDEVARLQSLFDGATSFEEGMQRALRAMLISPNFLYRSELGQPVGDGRFELTQYEIATALSYLFTASMPDEALLAAAAANELDTAEQRAAQAARLLETPAARDQIGIFAAQWLGADPFQTGEKNADVYPNYTRDVQIASDAELVAFVNHVIFEGTGKYQELLNADYVFVNEPLARFYGLSGVSGPELRQVPSDATRGGILGLASVLAAKAHSDDSSPIKRGVFVRKRLLCHELPAPPPAIDNTPPGLDPTLTTRERFAAHSQSAFCQRCHSYIDGIGFGLEGYDGAGEFRSAEFGMDVDDSGSIKALVGFDPDNLGGNFESVDFEGLRELSSLIASSPDAPDCLAKQYFRYARGSVETPSDACTIDALQDRFEASDYDIPSLLISIVELPTFTVRRQEEAQ